jgi:isopenicillin N synthase-like dioxygenase
MAQLTIPQVDLAEFSTGDAVRKGKFVRALGQAYEEIGFVAVKNHGLQDEIIEELYSQVHKFFALTDEQKAQYEIAGLAGQRGYTSFGKEHAKNHNAGDLKEFWQFGQCVDDDETLREVYPKNVSVAELPSFNPMAMRVYKTLEDTGRQMLQAIALYLGLDEHYFDAKIHNGNSILRAIHYPAITTDPGDAVRSAAHEDINLITLLMGASAEGLQVLNKKGEWIGVTALPEHIVVNVGDMLQRLTNDKLRSTTHRVVNPPKEKWAEPRFSIPFFLHPVSEMNLSCLPECVDAEHPKRYDDITAGEYLDERLAEIGLKK